MSHLVWGESDRVSSIFPFSRQFPPNMARASKNTVWRRNGVNMMMRTHLNVANMCRGSSWVYGNHQEFDLETCFWIHWTVSSVAFHKGSSFGSFQLTSASSKGKRHNAASERYVWYGSVWCKYMYNSYTRQRSPGRSSGSLLMPPNLNWHLARNEAKAVLSTMSSIPRILGYFQYVADDTIPY